MKDFSKATPRPWVIEPENNEYLHISNKDVIEVVASLYAEPLDENTKANAELIVTAVNNFDKMKEALGWALQLVEEAHKQHDTLTVYGVEKLAKAKQLLDSLNK